MHHYFIFAVKFAFFFGGVSALVLEIKRERKKKREKEESYYSRKAFRYMLDHGLIPDPRDFPDAQSSREAEDKIRQECIEKLKRGELK